ncbi:MAG: M50 family metallopeptidase [Defluviitaleaceae bacterium]|nr:M50 family metallopeptidase [Defluviitaleaceae bacterium]
MDILLRGLIGGIFGLFHGTILAIIIHELGHLVFGKLTGYSFVSFRVSSFIWFKEGEKIKFTRSKSMVAGQCLMSPPEGAGKFKFVWYNLGGGVFNILLAAVWWGIYLIVVNAVSDGLHWIWGIFFAIGIIGNIIIALLNLIPIVIAGMPNDGRNIREALKSEDAKRGLRLVFYVNSELAKGKKYRDFPPELFALNEDADLNNYFVASMLLMEAEQLNDSGEYEAAINMCSRLNLKKLPAVYTNGVKLEQIYFYTVHQRDLEKAALIYNDKRIKAFFATSKTIEYAWTVAAYEHFGLGNKEKAQKTLTRAKSQAESHPNAGERFMYKERLAHVAEAIEADKNQSEENDTTSLAELLKEANAWKEGERD